MFYSKSGFCSLFVTIFNMINSSCQSSTWGGHVVLPRDFSHLIVTESRDTSHIQDCLKKDLKFLENNNCIDYK